MAKEGSFELEIVRPTSSERFEVKHIKVQAKTGNFVVGPDHSPLVAILRHRGDLFFETVDGKQERIDIFGGLFVVKDGAATCILES